MEEKKLPTFYLDFEEDNMTAGMDAISFVDSPATQIKWEIFQSIEDSYSDYPVSASNNACRAIKYKEKNPNIDCGTQVGWTRANQLCSNRRISVETIARMASFKRHQQNKDVPYDKGCGGIVWDAWGGDEGIEWAIRKMEFINNRLKASVFEKFETIDEEKRIVSSPVMLAETPILRYNENIGKYNVKFSKETIEKMMKKYFKENKIHKVNLNHDPRTKQEGIYMIESYIVGDRNKSNLFQ
ncbi:MAG: Halovirus, partial [Bacteroidota bacterium]